MTKKTQYFPTPKHESFQEVEELVPLTPAEKTPMVVRWERISLRGVLRTLFVLTFSVSALAFGGLATQLAHGNDPALKPKVEVMAALVNQKVVHRIVKHVVIKHKIKRIYIRVYPKPVATAAATYSAPSYSAPSRSYSAPAPAYTPAPAPAPVRTRAS